MGNYTSTPKASQANRTLSEVDRLIANPTASIADLMKARDILYKMKSATSQAQARSLQTLINMTSREQNVQSRFGTINSMINSRQRQNRNKVRIINNRE